MPNPAKTRLALNVTTRSGSSAEAVSRQRVLTTALPAGVAPLAVAPAQAAGGLPPSPAEDLQFQGGRVLTDLTFTNFFVGGPESWQPSDVTNIDQALAAAMSDRKLNNVLVQYFFGSDITTSFKPSQFLPGPKPQVVSRGDLGQIVVEAHAQGLFNGFDLQTTVFNFLLPSGTILSDDEAVSGGQAQAPAGGQGDPGDPGEKNAAKEMAGLVEEEAADSTEGLGGYHGGVQIGNDTVYFAIGAFSETLQDGTSNGIPFFDEPWKNVVATFYHELCEARTDPDVERANATGDHAFLGWISNSREEIGDFALRRFALDQVLEEVPLANGAGTVPVQLEYSNFVHAPEGPADQPRPPV